MFRRAVLSAIPTALIAIPALAGETYAIDSGHSWIIFEAERGASSLISGLIPGVSGTIELDAENPAASSVSAQIDLSTVVTGSDRFDGHIQSPDFFDIEANGPTASFTSTAVNADENGEGTIEGELSLAGVTAPVTLTLTKAYVGPDPRGNAAAGFSATATLDRRDFGVSFFAPEGDVPGSSVTITVHLLAAPTAE